MTEDVWAEAEEDAIWPVIMPLSERRQRLLAVALVRSLARLESGAVVAAALEAAEKFADTRKSKAALKRSRDALGDARVNLYAAGHTTGRAMIGAFWTMRVAGIACSEEGPATAVRETVLTWREADGISKADARRRVYPVFREIAGPDRSVAFSPEWRTDTAVSLAKQMYESREFSAMPILADAIQDAGCDSTAVLDHCRDPHATHVRGCWVVDLVLSKG
jgi:hypothetical protein